MSYGQGRGGGRGGRGGGASSGKNRHMGENSSVLSLLPPVDAQILAVLNPPANQRDRSALINQDPGGPAMPPHASWRLTPSVGAQIGDSSHVVRANFFPMDTKRIVQTIAHYHVHMYRGKGHGFDDKDCAPDEESDKLVQVMGLLVSAHPEWSQVSSGAALGLAYDGRSALFASAPLPFSTVNTYGEPFLEETVTLVNLDGSQSNKQFKVIVTLLKQIDIQPQLGPDATRALEVILFQFARPEQSTGNPQWYISGSKLYRSSESTTRISEELLCRKGYYAGFKACMSGLCLVSDMAVSAFIVGGPIMNLMAVVGGFRNVNEMLLSCNRAPLRPEILSKFTEAFKGLKVRMLHVNITKKFKSMGPPPHSQDSKFDYNGTVNTVAQYFESRAKQDTSYKQAVDMNGNILHPNLPTVNVGTKKKPTLVPAYLIEIPEGQIRKKQSPEITSQLIRQAAVRPHERFKFIEGKDSIVGVTRSDPISNAFGTASVSKEPIACAAKLLPPATLAYGSSKVINPGLSGSWNIDRPQLMLYEPPPVAVGGGYMYGVLAVGTMQRTTWSDTVKDFSFDIEKAARTAGVNLVSGGVPFSAGNDKAEIHAKLQLMQQHGVRMVLVPLVADAYNIVKFVADSLGVVTQCLKWKNIENPPRGYHLNILLKMNLKMGGNNHILSSRLPLAQQKPPPNIFQVLPASISWLFDKPCMLVGIDVSHPEQGTDRDSLAAVVGSMNRYATQYVAFLSAQPARSELLSELTDSMEGLLTSFMQKNGGAPPAHIVIYRDGVSDGEFSKVLDNELPAIKAATSSIINTEVKIVIVICQKGHHTRIVYEERDGTYVNPCPGLVIDGSGGDRSIASASHIEFYLNSHAAIQGTSKPCKYSLIYDEIGMKLSEIELLTYWSTYLYGRCNKSVSIATPAYYAHWATQRARNLYAAGATKEDLKAISDTWSAPGRPSMMFFV